MKTNKTLKTVALASLMGSALLLTGCGGGGGAPTAEPSYTPPAGYTPPVEMGSVGRASDTLTYSAFGFDVTVNMSELIGLEATLDNQRYFSLKEIYDALSPSVRNQLVNQLASGSEYTAEYIHGNIQELSDRVLSNHGLIDAAEEAAVFANDGDGTSANPGFAGSPISESDVINAFNQIDAVGATEAWAQGWTGEGVTISRETRSETNGSAEVLLSAVAIAPGLDLRDVGQSTDIEVGDYNSVRLQRPGSSSYTKHTATNTPWKAGQFLGVSALVMQKFPTAENTSVGSAVNNSETNGNYNALRALSPSL